jgi:predicted ArsR family transcriptional regulator
MAPPYVSQCCTCETFVSVGAFVKQRLVKPLPSLDVTVSDAKRRLLELLKRQGPATPPEIAAALQLTTAAVRQHLGELEGTGLVAPSRRPVTGPGRPPSAWSLTDVANGLFPDRHADLTVELIQAMRRALGEAALEKVIDARRVDQVKAYRALLPGPRSPLRERVVALARQRTAEGYMAEAQAEDDGSCLLVEHHCPVCEAATVCQGLCRAELDVFRESLGRDVTVERERHLLSGDTRCVYRIRPTTTARGGRT